MSWRRVVRILLVVLGLSVSAGLLSIRTWGRVASIDLTVICRCRLFERAARV